MKLRINYMADKNGFKMINQDETEILQNKNQTMDYLS